MSAHYIIGIDEAWRGPWAGPVSVGGWMAHISLADSLLQWLVWLTDSKKLTSKKREKLFHEIEQLEEEGKCRYAYAESSAETIDALGIREANRQTMERVIYELITCMDRQDSVTIYIDGCDNYRFDFWDETVWYDFRKQSIEKTLKNGIPTGFEKIQVIYRIGWDMSVPPISAASIIAKVKRDRVMCDFHEKYPLYGFDSHKGYGTRKHQDALLHYGISPLHRKSYAPVKRLILADS